MIWRTPFQKKAPEYLEKYRSFVSAEFMKTARDFRPDFIFVIRGTYLNKECIISIRKELKIPVANWIIDDPSIPNVLEPAYFETLSAYSHIFLVDEGWGWPLPYVGAPKP